MLAFLFLIAAMAPPAAPAVAPPAAPMIVPPCAPPSGFPGWGRHPATTTPVRLGNGSPAAELPLGETVYVSLVPIGGVALALPLGKPAQPGDHGGIVTFTAAQAGTYRIALGGRAWIDVVRDGKGVAAGAHAMGTPCSGLAKMVDFALVPGSYAIQLSAAADPTLRIAIARLP